ncbi:MAG TPA: hypothetical protein VFE62_28070 [Gemmataceae bacterium]|nr:hypothetical protein [Gemmataceae bacterium]
MPDIDETADPRPGIRAVFLSGFLGGILVGLLYVLVTGYLFTITWFEDPSVFLIFAGVALGVGILGAMFGTFVGLVVRLLLHGTRVSDSWWPSILLSGLTSALIGLSFVVIILPMFASPE